MVRVHIKRLHPRAQIPFYATVGSAGFDIASIEDISIPAGATALVHTGLGMAIPFGYELQVRPRSGMALKTSYLVKNSPGTIDSDYRGEIGVIVHNLGTAPLEIKAGDRIAQGVVAPCYQAAFYEVDELDETKRGCGGFGSTGGKVEGLVC
jgi:dUTP pyrophosphatase